MNSIKYIAMIVFAASSMTLQAKPTTDTVKKYGKTAYTMTKQMLPSSVTQYTDGIVDSVTKTSSSQ